MTVREILCKARGTFIKGLPYCKTCCYKEECDEDVSSIRKLVLEKKKEYLSTRKSNYEERVGYLKAIDEIADMFKAEG